MSSILTSALSAIFTQLPSIKTKKYKRVCIVLSDGEKNIVLPVVPSNLPELSCPQNNDTFKGILGDMSIIGTMGLRTLKLQGLLPSDIKKYSWCYPMANNATEVINFINETRIKYIPFRIVITQGNNTILNMAVIVNNFTYYQDAVNDYHYSIDLIEYRTRDDKTGGLVS